MPSLWVTYEMMEAVLGRRRRGARPDWMEPFALDHRRGEEVRRVEHLDRVDWNAELVRGIWGRPFSGSSRSQVRTFGGGGSLPLALTELGLIDEYEFVMHPRLAAKDRHCSQG